MSAELEQGSEAWKLARLGKITASRLGDLMAKGQGKTRASYILELVAERLTGIPCGFEGNADTEFGNEQEPHARRAYEAVKAAFVQRVGFLPHPKFPTSGASPDGLVLEHRRGLELKSHRKPITHLKAIEGEIPRDHLYQCQWGMDCAGYEEWDYANWCPFMPEHLRLHVRTVKRDNGVLAQLRVAVEEAEAEIAATLKRWSPTAFGVGLEEALRATLKEKAA